MIPEKTGNTEGCWKNFSREEGQSMPKKKIAIIGLATASAIIFCTLIAGSFYFYGIGIQRSAKDLGPANQNLTTAYQESESLHTLDILAGDEPALFANSRQGWVENQQYETWTMTSEDGLKLAAYYIPAKEETTRTVIIAHGYLCQGKEMGKYARFYSEKLGFNVLLPDARGHGASEGDYIGFGWPDRKDYLLWIRKVLERVGNYAQIALHGVSMGGATVMMVSGESLPPQVKVIVEDSGYTSVYEELSYQMDRMFNLPGFPFISATSLLTKIKAGYNFSEASAIKQVKKNKTPMLFIHGTLDTVVPAEMVAQLYDACNAEKGIHLAEGAGHTEAYSLNETVYETKVAEFIGRYIQ